MESMEEAIEEEQVRENIGQHEILVNDEQPDDTQTENSFNQDDLQQSEQEQGLATDRVLG